MPQQGVSTYFIDHNLDQYDHMSMDLHRHVTSSHSGKGRSKKEASEHTNRPDTCGHNRKTFTKLVNNSHKQRVWDTEEATLTLKPFEITLTLEWWPLTARWTLNSELSPLANDTTNDGGLTSRFDPRGHVVDLWPLTYNLLTFHLTTGLGVNIRTRPISTQLFEYPLNYSNIDSTIRYSTEGWKSKSDI